MIEPTHELSKEMRNMHEALRHWQDVAATCKYEIDLQNQKILNLLDRIDELKTEIAVLAQ